MLLCTQNSISLLMFDALGSLRGIKGFWNGRRRGGRLWALRGAFFKSVKWEHLLTAEQKYQRKPKKHRFRVKVWRGSGSCYAQIEHPSCCSACVTQPAWRRLGCGLQSGPSSLQIPRPCSSAAASFVPASAETLSSFILSQGAAL